MFIWFAKVNQMGHVEIFLMIKNCLKNVGN